MVSHIASSAYRAILIGSYLLLTFLLTYVPYIGSVISFMYICWVNSYVLQAVFVKWTMD